MKAIPIIYAAIALCTFGYAAERFDREAWARYAVCQSVALNQAACGDCTEPFAFNATVVGMASGAAWPLYWSWEAASRIGEVPDLTGRS